MIEIIIIIILVAGAIYLFINLSAISPSTTTPNTIKFMPSTTLQPFVNPIPNFILVKGDKDLFYYLNKITDETIADETTADETTIKSNIKSNIQWNRDMNNIMNPIENDTDKIAVQFRYFAEFWLNKLNINSGFTNVFDSQGNIGKYEFSRNKNIYTAKFNNTVWTWNIIDYCFNTVNAKRENHCLGNWIYNNGKCYPPAESSSTCSNYDWNTMYNYFDQDHLNSWMKNCNVSNSSNCKYPIGKSTPETTMPSSINMPTPPPSIKRPQSMLDLIELPKTIINNSPTPVQSQPAPSQPAPSQPAPVPPPLQPAFIILQLEGVQGQGNIKLKFKSKSNSSDISWNISNQEYIVNPNSYIYIGGTKTPSIPAATKLKTSNNQIKYELRDDWGNILPSTGANEFVSIFIVDNNYVIRPNLSGEQLFYNTGWVGSWSFTIMAS